MRARDSVRLIARREFDEGVGSRAWRASVAIQVLVVAAIVIVSIVASGDDGPSERKLAVAGPQAAAVEAKARAAQGEYGIRLEVERVADARAARALVRDESVDAALLSAGIVAAEDPDSALIALLQSSARVVEGEAQLERAGLSPAEREAALEPPPLRLAEVEVGEGEGGEGLAFIGGLFLYIAILTFGYAIASSVVSEKSSRVVEVILSAIRPLELLGGKVLGVGLLGLLQLGLIAAAGLLIALPSGAISLPESTPETLALVLVYFILGYLFYGCLFAASASLVSRQEDAQSTTSPILIVAIAGYIASTATLGNASGTLAQLGTYLPPLAPMVVPGRAAQGALPAWELALSLLIMVASILVVMWIAGRIYQRSVLRFGTPMKLREAFSLLRS
jgi:ABC-2 type transport system permease protein